MFRSLTYHSPPLFRKEGKQDLLHFSFHVTVVDSKVCPQGLHDTIHAWNATFKGFRPQSTGHVQDSVT